MSILKLLHEEGIIKSFAEGRRLMESGGVNVDGEKVESDRNMTGGWHDVQVGNAIKFRLHITTEKEIALPNPIGEVSDAQ